MVVPLFIANSFLHPFGPVAQVERAFLQGLVDSEKYDIKVACSDFWDSEWISKQLIKIHENKIKRTAYAIFRRLGYTDLVNRPDADWFSWGKNAIKYLSSPNFANKYNYIHSFSLSCSNHLVALELKRRYGTPVIVHFFDPWYDNPYRHIKDSKLKQKDFELEKSVAENADIIIHDNDNIVKVWHNRYGNLIKDKTFTLPLVFSVPNVQNILKGNGKLFNNKFVISHIGNLNKSRNLIDFIDVISILTKKYPGIKEHILVNFVGNVPDIQKKYVVDLHLDDCVKFIGQITERECYKYYTYSDMFLATDPVNELDVYFPSKLMKYFYFQKPILGITPKGSVMDKELVISGNYSFRHNEKENISDFIYSAMKNTENIITHIDKEYWLKFSSNNVAQEYTNILKRMNFLNNSN